MDKRLPGWIDLPDEADSVMPAVVTDRVSVSVAESELGPFVVRRFVDFSRTKSMICRPAA